MIAASTREHAVEIRQACWPADLRVTRDLLRLYARFLQNNPAGPVSICLEHFDREVESLSLRYPGDARGTLFLAWRGTEAVGCAGTRMLPKRPEAAEMKRLYVLPEARGAGIGRLLIEAVIGWALNHGAAELLLDTVPAAMPEAVRLYRSIGFQPSERYHDGDLAGLEFYRRSLQ